MLAQTSLLAYRQLDETKLNFRQKKVLEALEEIQPATNKMIAAHLDWAINTVTPRCLELRGKGKVIEAFIGTDSTGRKASFWRLKKVPKEFGDSA